MINKNLLASAVLGFAIANVSVPALAENEPTNFTFSESLQATFESLAEAHQSLRSEIGAALSGLSREEARGVRDAFSEQVQALRAETQAARALGRAEMEAAGVTPTPPGGRGPNGAGGRGGPDGPGGPGGPGGAGGRR